MRISTGSGEISLDELQPAGGRAMPARDYLNGTQLAAGTPVGMS